MGQMTTHRSASHRLPLAILVALCVPVGLLAFGSAPALARTSHTYESQITEIPASSGAPVPGALTSPNSMTVYGGDLYVAEELDGYVSYGPGQTTSFRADQFGLSKSAPPAYEFVSQLPQFSGLASDDGQGGIAFGTSTGESEIYLGLGQESKRTVAVLSAGVCGTLECASLQGEWTGSDAPGGSFGNLNISDVAVDESTTNPEDWAKGDVFVASNTLIFHPTKEEGTPHRRKGKHYRCLQTRNQWQGEICHPADRVSAKSRGCRSGKDGGIGLQRRHRCQKGA